MLEWPLLFILIVGGSESFTIILCCLPDLEHVQHDHGLRRKSNPASAAEAAQAYDKHRSRLRVQ